MTDHSAPTVNYYNKVKVRGTSYSHVWAQWSIPSLWTLSLWWAKTITLRHRVSLGTKPSTSQPKSEGVELGELSPNCPEPLDLWLHHVPQVYEYFNIQNRLYCGWWLCGASLSDLCHAEVPMSSLSKTLVILRFAIKSVHKYLTANEQPQ